MPLDWMWSLSMGAPAIALISRCAIPRNLVSLPWQLKPTVPAIIPHRRPATETGYVKSILRGLDGGSVESGRPIGSTTTNRKYARVLAAYETAVAEIHSGKIASRSSDFDSDLSRNEPRAGAPSSGTDSPPRRHSAPGIWVYDSIDEYSHEELVAIARWIESDGLLRTDAQLFEEIFDELPFRRRGSRIEEAIDTAIASARKRRMQT